MGMIDVPNECPDCMRTGLCMSCNGIGVDQEKQTGEEREGAERLFESRYDPQWCCDYPSWSRDSAG